MIFLGKEEIQSKRLVLYFNGGFVQLSFQKKLLESQERFFVHDFLSNLDESLPSMGRELLFAVVALSVDFLKLCLERLLNGDLLVDAFLHPDFYENPLGMLLGPDEIRLQKFQFRQSA